MASASVTLDPAYRIGEVDPRLFGSFVEHLGRCVYGGIYEPGHPSADEAGFRGDVADLVRGLDVPIIRYPGGNFVSGYRWEDGVGPVADRPKRLDLAWHALEANAVGTDEFCHWARGIGAEPMLAVNLGTRGIEAATSLLEYCNHPGGTYWSDLRRHNGSAAPHDVRVWCLGNEMDGPWQLGFKTADEYGRLAAQTAMAMKALDPGIELVACGSSGRAMPTFGSWEATVLEHAYEHVDHLSVHSYFEEKPGDRGSFLASSTAMDSFIDDVVATADFVRAKRRHRKRLTLSFDEWNVWYQSRHQQGSQWSEVPEEIEDIYSSVDAVVVGSLLMSLLRHADRVAIGCLAQLVNVIAPILTRTGGPAWRQASYDPIALTARHGRGVALRTVVTSPSYDTREYGEVPLLDAVAVTTPDEGLSVFAVNRDLTEPMGLELDLRGFPTVELTEHVTLADADPDAVNTAEQPDRVRARGLPVRQPDGGRVAVTLPAMSWNLLRLRPRAGAR